jgi:hypothetical protein
MWCAFYLGLLFFCGYAVVAPLSKGRCRLEIAGLSACLGPALMGLLLLLLSMLGMKPSRAELLIIAIPAAAASALWLKLPAPRSRPVKRAFPPVAKFWAVLCAAGILYALVSIAADALTNPVTEWDAFAIWQLKGKLLAVYPLFPKPGYFSTLSLSFSHLRYPLLWPMISAGMHAMTGTLDDAGKMPSILLAVGLPLALYSALRESRSRAVSLAAIALMLNVSTLYNCGGSGTAEMPLTAFYGGSILCLLRWQKRGFFGDFVLAALFTAMLPLTKNEGAPLAIINALAVLFFAPMEWPKAMRAAALFCAIVFALYLPWLLFVHGIPSSDEDYIHRLTPGLMLAHLDRLPTILAAFWREATFARYADHPGITADWGLFWLILGLLAIAQWRKFKAKAVSMLGILLVLHFAAYIPPYLVVGDQWHLTELLDVTTGRLLLHMAPAAALLIGLLWPTWAEEPESRVDERASVASALENA